MMINEERHWQMTSWLSASPSWTIISIPMFDLLKYLGWTANSMVRPILPPDPDPVKKLSV
jgi:hypothetical protein